ncbi:MAG TPA: exosortase A [Crenotrichaceae bacterium]|nr:exosortase A [Crenotrichaceae bacterium]
MLWKSLLPYLVVSFLLLSIIYWQTLFSMVSTWWHIGTYTHGFVIFPVSLWIIWLLKDSIIRSAPEPTPKAIIALFILSLIWLIANLGGLIGIQQFAFISLILLFTWTLLGKEICKKLMFPLFFLYLAVPFGDFLLQPMMNFTADFTVVLLRLTGLPVYRNGLFFMLPTGQWSVAEACSGVRYLIASITVGVLFAYFCYSSLYKRLIFTAVSIFTPIIANSLRAYLIVLIGHFSNMKLATGVDHFVYGWLFFGIVITIMMWVGSLFQDQYQSVEDNHSNTHQNPGSDSSSRDYQDIIRRTIVVSILALLTCSLGPVCAYRLNQQSQQQINLESITLPQSQSPWWRINDADDWQPGYTGHALTLSSVYQNQLGQVQLTMIFYPHESQGHELVNGQNSLLPDAQSNWHLISETLRRPDFALTSTIEVRESLIASDQYRLVWQFNWVIGQFLSNDIKAKMIAVKHRILGQNSHSVAIFISTKTNEEITDAQFRLSDFLQTFAPSIGQTIGQFKTLTTHLSLTQ